LDFGTIKNVGIAVVNSIVEERNKNGEFEDFTSFCERIKDAGVNKKCVESLIKAGAFDSFGKTRATLLASFENILDTINNEARNKIENQVSMFDIMEETKEIPKYTYIEKKEMDEKELLSLEKEMLGLYISGHPLDKIRTQIEKISNFTTLDISKMNEELEQIGKTIDFKDGQTVRYVGIINKVNKKFTKNNKTMAFLNVEDFYGSAEIIVFDSVYNLTNYILVEENIVLIEGRISIREDEPVKLVASKITEFSEDLNVVNKEENTQKLNNKIKTLSINITRLEENRKEKLRGAIKFFSGDRVNVKLEIVDKDSVKPCGAIYMTDKILEIFEKIVDKENINLV